LVSSVEKLRLKNKHDDQMKSRKALFKCDGEGLADPTFDHLSYTFKKQPEIQDKQKNTEEMKKMLEKTPKENYLSYILDVKQFMQKMKIPGVSVLSQNAPQDLSNPCLLTEAAQEMESNCEFLFDILNAALGDKISETSKIATIATIYGMFMHSNNNKISAIQRLFTSTVVRYHADNKV
jgi:hypothetical protein